MEKKKIKSGYVLVLTGKATVKAAAKGKLTKTKSSTKQTENENAVFLEINTKSINMLIPTVQRDAA